jgi:hypothetical protein
MYQDGYVTVKVHTRARCTDDTRCAGIIQHVVPRPRRLNRKNLPLLRLKDRGLWRRGQIVSRRSCCPAGREAGRRAYPVQRARAGGRARSAGACGRAGAVPCCAPVPLFPFARNIRLPRKLWATGVAQMFRDGRIFRGKFRIAEPGGHLPSRPGSRWGQRGARDRRTAAGTGRARPGLVHARPTWPGRSISGGRCGGKMQQPRCPGLLSPIRKATMTCFSDLH